MAQMGKERVYEVLIENRHPKRSCPRLVNSQAQFVSMVPAKAQGLSDGLPEEGVVHAFPKQREEEGIFAALSQGTYRAGSLFQCFQQLGRRNALGHWEPALVSGRNFTLSHALSPDEACAAHAASRVARLGMGLGRNTGALTRAKQAWRQFPLWRYLS